MAIGHSRKDETVLDAANQVKQLHQEIQAVRNQLQHLRQVMHAFWELSKGKLEADDEQLWHLVKSIEENERLGVKVAEKCPQCSRALQANSDFCIYCGSSVSQHRVF